jgi:large subunit ribosomal protein L11
MAKEIVGYLRLQLKGGSATPGAPIAPAFGSKGLSQHMMEFCKQFNAQTQNQAGKILPVVVTIYADKTIDFKIKSEPASLAILKMAGIQKGSSKPNQEKVGKISRNDLIKIAQDKMADLNALTLEAAAKIIAGTAHTLGVEVVD